MPIICDTHVLLFWADAADRLPAKARAALDRGIQSSSLACSDISFWEIAMLFAHDRLNRQAGVAPEAYMRDIVCAMRLQVLPVTPEIAALSQSYPLLHEDPADRLIAATALIHRALLLTADEKLRQTPNLVTLWD
jgi:PIN domain nuclease of toxin-antitoxin system